MLYGTPNLASMSAKPITPNPIFRVLRFISRISGSAYSLTSIVLSRKCTAVCTVFANLSQSMLGSESLVLECKRPNSGFNAARCTSSRSIKPTAGSPATKFARLIDPKLHDSFGSNGCSPQGFVAVIRPTCDTGLRRFTSSRKIMPGSPLFQAPLTILSNTVRASSRSCSTNGLSGSAGCWRNRSG